MYKPGTMLAFIGVDGEGKEWTENKPDLGMVLRSEEWKHFGDRDGLRLTVLWLASNQTLVEYSATEIKEYRRNYRRIEKKVNRRET